MKKNVQILIYLSIVFFAFTQNSNAQRQVVIEGYPKLVGGDINDYIDVITKALDADTTLRETDPDVVYVLKRDHIYPNATTIKNTYNLKMVAEDGDGSLPALVMIANDAGKYKRFLEAQDDVYFENIQFENQQPDGAIRSRSQRLVANGIRGEFNGCVFYQDGGGAITTWADSISVFVYNCFAHSIGRKGENNSNGRFVGLRNDNYTDTVVIQNCTSDHLNGSNLRSGSSIIGYLKIDHLTSFNNRDGGIIAYKAKEVIITNNLLMNTQMLGHYPAMTAEVIDPDNLINTAIDIDTVWDASKIIVRNNNIFYTDEVKALWAKYDTITEPRKVNPKIMRALGADSVNAAFSEVVTFNAICDAPLDYIDSIFFNIEAGTFPNQLCLGGSTNGGLFPFQVDASYDTTSTSYTAADGNFPLGDLNWFPKLKELFDAGDSVTITGIEYISVISSELVKVYPNPVSDILTIITDSEEVLKFEMYNLLGAKLQSISFNSGKIDVNMNGFENGSYFYRISDSKNRLIKTGKLVIIK